MIALVAAISLGAILHPLKDDPGFAWLTALITNWISLIGHLFLRLILMIVVPLVVAALLLGMYELGSGHAMGRVLAKTLGCTVITSTAAVIIGVGLVGYFEPGANVELDSAETANATSVLQAAASTKSLPEILLDLVPKNPLGAAVRALEGEMIALMVACLIIGAAMSSGQVRDKVSQTLVPFLEQVFEVCLRVVTFAMALAPAGVFSLVLTTTYINGVEVLLSLLGYVGVVVGALLIQQLVVYPILLATLARRSPWIFFRDCREVFVYAFSTSSSNATLPKSLETAETKLGIPRRISRFVLTVGATANQNGTALFEGITVLFLAQVYNIELTLGQQITVVLMSILAGIGTAGVPSGSLPLIVILMEMVGIPGEGIALILGVDRFLDMCRTVVNVSGDLVIAAIVGRAEPQTLDQSDPSSLTHNR